MDQHSAIMAPRGSQVAAIKGSFRSDTMQTERREIENPAEKILEVLYFQNEAMRAARSAPEERVIVSIP